MYKDISSQVNETQGQVKDKRTALDALSHPNNILKLEDNLAIKKQNQKDAEEQQRESNKHLIRIPLSIEWHTLKE